MAVVLVVGKSNVGKSTLFNKLIGKRKSIVADEERVTRDVVVDHVHFNDKSFELVDTCGIFSPKQGELSEEEETIYKKSIENTIRMLKEADLIPDVIINNAGFFPPQKEFGDLSERQWDEVFRINLKSSMLVSKEFATIAKNGSRIVNISSLGGIQVWKNRIDYNVSKSALIQLSKALARALAPRINVNTVCPGFIDLPKENNINPNTINIGKIPMQRYGTIEDIFDAVFFFATCSDFITGQTIVVDGGQSLIH